MDELIYTSVPAPLNNDDKPTNVACNMPQSDNETLRRQACMYASNGELICSDKRSDGLTMIVKDPNATSVQGYCL